MMDRMAALLSKVRDSDWMVLADEFINEYELAIEIGYVPMHDESIMYETLVNRYLDYACEPIEREEEDEAY